MQAHSKFQCDRAFELARETYAAIGSDVEAALTSLAALSVSLNCWQGDDVRGFEATDVELGGGLAVTGCYPGRAQNAEQLRADIELAYKLIPGRHRLNLHASYGEFQGARIDRDQIEYKHYAGWVDWAKHHHICLDFNPTFFAHPRASSGRTLTHPDPATQAFWVEHGRASRRIAATIGRELKSACVNNVWIPDGSKDTPVDRTGPRLHLLRALDEVFHEPFDQSELRDAVECKLFGLGSESYVVGSHEFYLGYAITRGKVLCLDAGHFHPTESISDKISSTLLYVPELLLHVSRGVRWDSDHVVIWNDDLSAIAQELVRGDYLHRVHLGLDFFDASINRIAAWVIGTRSLLKALLAALLEPRQRLKQLEQQGDYTGRLALLEELKTMPLGAVWDQYCLRAEVPCGERWLDEVRHYEHSVLANRC